MPTKTKAVWRVLIRDSGAWVPVGRFRGLSSAQILMQRLQDAGFSVYIRRKRGSGA
jgi:hypothetical protein